MKNIVSSLLFLTAIIVCSCTGGKRTSNVSTSVTDLGENNSTTINSSNSLPEHPIINVYLENSGSMNGYVDGGKTMFQQDVYNYLSDVDISGIPSEMNMFFINSKIIPQRDFQKSNTISDFINRLNPNSFRVAGGNTATTDMADIFKLILENTDNDIVSIFISDCIFSPGSVSSPEAYLTNQQIGIKENFAKYCVDHPNFGVMVYQLSSNFNGRYYDYMNKPHQYNGERPYYIWVMGNIYYLMYLKDRIPNKKFQGSGVQNYWFASNFQLEEVAYSVLPAPRLGSFDKVSKSDIKNMKPDENGEFMFTIAANLRLLELVLGDDYLMDTGNYAQLINKELSDEIKIKIDRNTVAKSPATHNISLKIVKGIQREEIKVILQCLPPEWGFEMTDDNDTQLTELNCNKTYGLKYLLNGVQQGLTARGSGYYMYMIVNLK